MVLQLAMIGLPLKLYFSSDQKNLKTSHLIIIFVNILCFALHATHQIKQPVGDQRALSNLAEQLGIATQVWMQYLHTPETRPWSKKTDRDAHRFI